LKRGWADVCLSNPDTGMPISIDPIKPKQRRIKINELYP
jgi:hypothetical protein